MKKQYIYIEVAIVNQYFETRVFLQKFEIFVDVTVPFSKPCHTKAFFLNTTTMLKVQTTKS